MSIQDKKKIFCIGFNKTGTTSLHSFFKNCGLSSHHNDEWPIYSKFKLGRFYYRRQCYTDGEQADFQNLDIWFPGSVFILNTRKERDWLHSRIKHVMRHNEKLDLKTLLLDKKYGKMAKEFHTDPEAALNKWIYERRVYTEQAKEYFKDRNDFIEIDITKEDQWEKTLLKFIKANSFSPKDQQKEIQTHRNKRDKSAIEDKLTLEKYLNLVDKILGIKKQHSNLKP